MSNKQFPSTNHSASYANSMTLVNDLSMESDDDLMLRVQLGETRAFEVLVEKHQRDLLGFLLKSTRDLQFAEDLAQETFLKLHSQAWDYLPRNKFRGWLFRIARNLFIDNIRKRTHDALVKALKAPQTDDYPEQIDRLKSNILSPEMKINREEFTQKVNHLLLQIPEEQRTTFSLYVFQDFTLQEIAETTDCQLSTCKSRLRLAREKLRELLVSSGFISQDELQMLVKRNPADSFSENIPFEQVEPASNTIRRPS